MKKRNPNYEEEGITNVNFEDAKFYAHIRNKNHSNSENIRKVLYTLAICHTVIAVEKKGKQEYNASSPDELALVNAAKFFGYKFIGRDSENNIIVEVSGGITEKFKLLDLIEFSSTR